MDQESFRVRLDLSARQVRLDTGERLRFDGLVIATGARARRLRPDGVDPSCTTYAVRGRSPAPPGASQGRPGRSRDRRRSPRLGGRVCRGRSSAIRSPWSRQPRGRCWACSGRRSPTTALDSTATEASTYGSQRTCCRCHQRPGGASARSPCWATSRARANGDACRRGGRCSGTFAETSWLHGSGLDCDGGVRTDNSLRSLTTTALPSTAWSSSAMSPVCHNRWSGESPAGSSTGPLPSATPRSPLSTLLGLQPARPPPVPSFSTQQHGLQHPRCRHARCRRYHDDRGWSDGRPPLRRDAGRCADASSAPSPSTTPPGWCPIGQSSRSRP